jgi:hypothetical protein
MSKSEKHVRDLPHTEYVAARRKAARDEPPADPAPCDRPLPPPAMTMTANDYEAAKRLIARS